MMRPDKFYAVGGLSTPFSPRGAMSVLDAARFSGRTDFYQLYFQTPGKVESEFEVDVAATIRRVLWSLSGGPPEIWRGIIGQQGAFEMLSEPTRSMDWLSDEDLEFYTAEFRKNGFRGPLNWYRNIDLNWSLTSPYQGATIQQPAMFVSGDRDPILSIYRRAVDALPGVLPNLRVKEILPGVGHWTQQEAPEAVSQIMIDFLTGML